jgi:hypothetical protein
VKHEGDLDAAYQEYAEFFRDPDSATPDVREAFERAGRGHDPERLDQAASEYARQAQEGRAAARAERQHYAAEDATHQLREGENGGRLPGDSMGFSDAINDLAGAMQASAALKRADQEALTKPRDRESLDEAINTYTNTR